MWNYSLKLAWAQYEVEANLTRQLKYVKEIPDQTFY
jgi:hypothetical protein